MKKLILGATALLLCTLMSCSSDQGAPTQTDVDFSGQVENETISIDVPGGRSVKAYLSKPAGESVDMVLALHGGSPTLENSISSAATYNTKPDGGRQFLENGYGVLSLEYTEFETNGEKATRGFKEMEEVLAATDFLLGKGLAKNKVNIGKVYVFGHSRGGGNALLAGIERDLEAVIAAEPPLDWERTRDSIVSGGLKTDVTLIDQFEESVSEWSEADFVTYSPAKRLEDFKTRFLIISGELDEAVMIEIAEDMQAAYLDCATDCIPGSDFILHERGHSDWAEVKGILADIQEFMR